MHRLLSPRRGCDVTHKEPIAPSLPHCTHAVPFVRLLCALQKTVILDIRTNVLTNILLERNLFVTWGLPVSGKAFIPTTSSRQQVWREEREDNGKSEGSGWNNLARADLTEAGKRHLLVCSDHFLSFKYMFVSYLRHNIRIKSIN